MKTESATIQLNVEIPIEVKRRLKSEAALQGISLKELASQRLCEPPIVNSTVQPAAPSAAFVARAALKGLPPTPPVDAPIGAASKPANAGRMPKARQQ